MINKKFLLIVFLIVILAGCGEMEVASMWKDRDIVIDGKDSDWSGRKYYNEDKNVAVGMMNDDKYLYMCFTAGDKDDAAKMAMQGMTVWFSGDGEKERDFGVHIPPSRDMMDERIKKDNSGFGDKTWEKEFPKDSFGKMMEHRPDRLQILTRSGVPVEHLNMGNTPGLEAKSGTHMGSLTYEMKIPYIDDMSYPVSIDAKENKEIMICLQSGMGKNRPMKMEKGDGGFGMGDRPEGMPEGGPGGRGKPGGGKGGFPGGEHSSEVREIWLKVRLATR